MASLGLPLTAPSTNNIKCGTRDRNENRQKLHQMSLRRSESTPVDQRPFSSSPHRNRSQCDPESSMRVSVPREIVPRDDATVVSCITLDPSLIVFKPEDRETRWGNGEVKTKTASSPKVTSRASNNASTPKRSSGDSVIMSGNCCVEEKSTLSSHQRDIEECLCSIHNDSLGDIQISVLTSLATLVKANPDTAERIFSKPHGMQCLQKVLWNTDRSKLAAAFDIFVTLVKPRTSGPVSLVVTAEGFDNCIDAVLIGMQSHKADESIQARGCIVFHLLACESSVHSNVDDGTASGAVVAVISAMEAHMNSSRVQISGAQALSSQCSRSKNAQQNQQTLSSLTLDSGITSSQILQNSLVLATFTTELADPLCHLYHSLSTNLDVVQRLSPLSDVLRCLLSLIRVLQSNPNASDSIKVALGALANLTGTNQNQKGISMSAAVSLALELMKNHCDHQGVQSEARRFIANILPLTKDVESLVQSGSVALIFTSILEPTVSESEVRDGVKILKCFIDLSVEARTEFVKFELHPHVKAILVRFKSSLPLHVELFNLILKAIEDHELDWDQSTSIVGLACQAMSSHPDSQDVQTIGCNIFREVAKHKSCCMAVAENSVLNLVTLAMERFHESSAIHQYGCYILCKAASTGNIGNLAIHLQLPCLDAVFRSLQSHLDSPPTVKMGFSALWSLIRESEPLQAHLVDLIQSADVLSQALVLHASVPGVLDKAYGILSTLCSTSPDRAANLVTISAVEAVVNVMIHNRNDPSLHHLCIMYIKSALLAKPQLGTHGCIAVTSVLQVLHTTRHDDDIQHCTCLLLWLLSQSSSDNKRMIAEANGYAMLIETFKVSNNADVRDAACLALNELLPEQNVHPSAGYDS